MNPTMSPAMQTFTTLAREHEIRRLLGEGGVDEDGILVQLRAAWDALTDAERVQLLEADGRAALVA